MRNLVQEIGPAPSELPLEGFLEKLKGERRRVSEAITAWRQENLPKSEKKKTTTKRKKRKAKAYDAVTEMLAGLGTNRDEILELLAKQNMEDKRKDG